MILAWPTRILFLIKQVKEGKTDAEGNADEVYEVPVTYSNMGALQTNFYTTVFDETGRPVSRGASVDIYTQDVFFGVKYDWFYYYPLNQPVKFNWQLQIRMGMLLTLQQGLK